MRVKKELHPCLDFLTLVFFAMALFVVLVFTKAFYPIWLTREKQRFLLKYDKESKNRYQKK